MNYSFSLQKVGSINLIRNRPFVHNLVSKNNQYKTNSVFRNFLLFLLTFLQKLLHFFKIDKIEYFISSYFVTLRVVINKSLYKCRSTRSTYSYADRLSCYRVRLLSSYRCLMLTYIHYAYFHYIWMDSKTLTFDQS